VKPKADKNVLVWVGSIPEDRLHISVITLGELHKGICKLGPCDRQNRLLRWLDVDVRQRFEGRILALDEDTLLHWGRLAGEAERCGKPQPIIDSLLAASAVANHLTLVTRNIADMEQTGVEILDPWVRAD
jgi:predicted nucleic acid-binding protein